MRSEGVLAMWPATYPAYPAAGENLKLREKVERDASENSNGRSWGGTCVGPDRSRWWLDTHGI